MLSMSTALWSSIPVSWRLALLMVFTSGEAHLRSRRPSHRQLAGCRGYALQSRRWPCGLLRERLHLPRDHREPRARRARARRLDGRVEREQRGLRRHPLDQPDHRADARCGCRETARGPIGAARSVAVRSVAFLGGGDFVPERAISANSSRAAWRPRRRRGRRVRPRRRRSRCARMSRLRTPRSAAVTRISSPAFRRPRPFPRP